MAANPSRETRAATLAVHAGTKPDLKPART
jgi:hypothetical protein